MFNVTLLSVIMQIDIMLSAIMLSVYADLIILSITIFCVIMKSVILLCAYLPKCHYGKSYYTMCCNIEFC